MALRCHRALNPPCLAFSLSCMCEAMSCLVTLLPLLFLFHYKFAFAKIKDVELTALRQFGIDLGYTGDDAFYSDPCRYSSSKTAGTPYAKCDRTNSSIVELSFWQIGLTGIFSDQVGSFTQLQSLDLSSNSLTGQIPQAIGNLTFLTYLKLASNKLSGSIPEEFGNLGKLINFYAEHNQLTGSIPSSVGKLTQLQGFRVYHNFLNGSIPSQLGNCISLTTLRLQENSFSGEVSFLTKLVNIEYIDLSYNNFSGDIFKYVQGLNILYRAHFRKNNFTGSPSAISGTLSYLDVAFNQISGSIPQNFGGESLSYLFLDHNNLEGEIPAKSFSSMTNLEMLDLSHNVLNGSVSKFRAYLPSTDINLAFNYFIDSSPVEFRCSSPNSTLLDHCTPSTTGNGQGFAINAGGENITFQGVEFQYDQHEWEHGFGLHYDSSRNWAVENSETAKIISQPDLTDLPELYRTMRKSGEYLAYHGTQLQLGTYNVTLYFAEIEGEYVGFRVFDVYIQGRLVRKDLDIFALVQKNAPYVISYQSQVTSGILSVQLIYNGKANGSDAGGEGPMISGIHVILTSASGVTNTITSSNLKLKGILIGCVLAVALVLVIGGLVMFCLRKKKRQGLHQEQKKIGLIKYSYGSLRKATYGFNESNKIGEGGFGSVYKGTLPCGDTVAIKRLIGDKTDQQKFMKEIQLISMVRHQNLVDVLGYCIYAHKSVEKFLLVCDYMPNGSLEKLLFPENGDFVLSWELRYKIAVGTARGLAYLHDESKVHIIHCDVKPHNILLDEEFNPCLSDFGLARLFDDNRSHVTASRLQGTVGYLAPEYATKHQVSEKVDVYSFGVVLLELLSGRHVIDIQNTEELNFLVDWAHELGQCNFELLLDKRLGDKISMAEARTVAYVAILCTNASANLRPRMRDVKLMLEGIIQVPDLEWNSVGEGTSFQSSHSLPLLQSPLGTVMIHQQAQRQTL